MNAARFSSMSRLILNRHQQLLLASTKKIDVGKLTNEILAINFLLSKRWQSSSSNSSTGPPATRYGTGEFGSPAPTPQNVTIPPLMPSEQPGPDEDPQSYAPVYRKGRFDWLFGDGWRRPPAKDQGQKMRRDWIAFGYHPTDEYIDWKWHHMTMFWFSVGLASAMFWFIYAPDWPIAREWAVREAYIEIARREKYGLPYISKEYIDKEKILATLPSEEELGDFDIII